MSAVGLYRRGRDSKFGNHPQRCAQNLMHHSKLEAQQCNVLHAMQSGGLIRDLQAHPQPRYRLEVEGEHICDVMPDFEFVWVEDGRTETVDTKGLLTDVARIKYRLFKALYGREIQLVRRAWGVR